MLCTCCYVRAVFGGGSHTEKPVSICEACAPHFGDYKKTSAAHAPMMGNYREQNAKMLERMQGQIDAMAAQRDAAKVIADELTAAVASDYLTRPIGDVQKVVESVVVDDLTSQANNSRKVRNRVMGAVFRIDELHHANGDMCTCKKRLTECKEFNSLNFIRATYYQWESRQIERLEADKPHGLPRDHPSAQRYEGRTWKGLPSTVQDYFAR